MAEGVATVNSPPKEGQLVEHQGTTYTTIKEGLAHILVPPGARTSVDPQAKRQPTEEADQAQNVFYNPIQQFNRDLSVLAIRAFGEDFCERRRQKAEKKIEFNKKRKEKKKHMTETSQALDGEQSTAEKNGQYAGPEAAVDGEKGAVADPQQQESGVLKRKAEDELLEGNETKRAKVHETEDVTTGDDATAKEPTNATEPTNGEQETKKTAAPTIRILDALSATGLRALRYAQEFPFDTAITANDLLPAATESIRMNVEHNRLKDKITPVTSNALAHMYNAAFAGAPHEYGKYDVIDLDPYGTAVPFLEAALLAVIDGGLLCVTCTDAGVWASCGYVEKTFSLYGGISTKGPHSHEAGLRIILHSIATTAAKHSISIEPLLSLSIDFYARVFVRVRKSAADVKMLAGKTMLVHQCDSGCGAWTTQTVARNVIQTGKKDTQFFKHSPAQTTGSIHCPQCNSKTHVAGPMWGGQLHNPFFISRILSYLPDLDPTTYATASRVEGMLTSALDELEVLDSVTDAKQANATGPSALIPALKPETYDPHPFFFVPSALSKVVHCQAPSESAIKGALRHAGYVATRSHTKPGCIKTQAPWDVIWEIMREWIRQKAPVKKTSFKPNTAGWNIIKDHIKTDEEDQSMVDNDGKGERFELLPSSRKVEFDEKLGKDKDPKRLLRYQLNPRANWGPMARAKGPP
ncbi:hypothetical protein MBLNU457_4939t1 [Dothideomycetes sp. NU457]